MHKTQSQLYKRLTGSEHWTTLTIGKVPRSRENISSRPPKILTGKSNIKSQYGILSAPATDWSAQQILAVVHCLHNTDDDDEHVTRTIRVLHLA